jgi:predicted DNA-binding transcriptional regulator AlpA
LGAAIPPHIDSNQGATPVEVAMSPRSPVITPPNLRTTEEVAETLRVAPVTLKTWRAQGRGPNYIRVGRQVRYRDDDIAQWLDQRTKAGEV